MVRERICIVSFGVEMGIRGCHGRRWTTTIQQQVMMYNTVTVHEVKLDLRLHIISDYIHRAQGSTSSHHVAQQRNRHGEDADTATHHDESVAVDDM